MVSQATIIRDLIETNWDLTGRLSKTPSDKMKEIVYFFDRQQVEGNEKTKAVVVRKINAEGKENQIEHPNFIEVQDVYEITLYYRVIDVQDVSFSEALEDVELMGTETLDTLELAFSPSMGNGIFWQVDRAWHKHDMLDQAQPELRRTLTMRMSRITSFDGNLFTGFGGLLHFGSESGHLYAEIQNIDTGGVGYPQIAEPIANSNTPVYFTGLLAGALTADMYLSPADISSDPSDEFALNQIGTINTNGEVFESTLIQLYDNDASPQQRVTITTKVKITSILFVANVQDMMKFQMVGEIIEYPTISVGATP